MNISVITDGDLIRIVALSNSDGPSVDEIKAYNELLRRGFSHGSIDLKSQCYIEDMYGHANQTQTYWNKLAKDFT